MELVLVRHGLPVRRELVEGVADPELAPDGQAQANRLADYLATEDITAMYVSPLKRAVETAGPLAAKLGITPVIDDDISEFDRNSKEYVPMEELRGTNDPRWLKMIRGEWEEGHDHPDLFRKRVIAACERMIERHPGERVVAVCHGGVINQYLAHILGIQTQLGFFYPHYTSIHRVIASREGLRTLATLNEIAHLRG
ncbi:MAG: histidine phosphatase family protein [Actinomycetota bacterium]